MSLALLLMITILTLNVQGFRNPDKQREVVDFLRQNRVDIAFLQEVNFYTSQDVLSFQKAFNVSSYFSLASSRSCGVGILVMSQSVWSSGFCSVDSEGRLLSFTVNIGDKQFQFINVYAAAKLSASNRFFRATGVYLLNPGPVIFCGDFNCVLDSTEMAEAQVRAGPYGMRPN